MQFFEADPNSCNRVEVSEQLIKFRPSTNFKTMKKFIQTRLETANNGPQNFGPDPPPPPIITQEKTKPDNHHFQPPLPLDPPPPDNILIKVKEEVVDPEYQNACTSSEVENQQSLQSLVSTLTQESTEDNKPICRDFNRGICKRQGCKYAHRHTFCRQYQNAVCTFTNCKYVHASVFEEQEFYRSGYLPPHAFAHNRVDMLQPPPPPPPPPEEPPVDVLLNINFSKPPPPMPNIMENPIMPCMPSTSRDSRLFIDNMGHPSTSSSLKRDWSQMEQYSAQQCIYNYNEHLPKKCKHCDIMEYRLQYNKDKVEQMLHSKEELNKKMAVLDKKSEKLYSVILSLLKPTFSKDAGPSESRYDDREKILLEQLTNIFNANRMSALREDK